LLPVGVDRRMLDLWLIGNAGYWGPPGTLPPPGADGHAPLLASATRVSMLRPALRVATGSTSRPTALSSVYLATPDEAIRVA
jgi:hypothetical protein